MIPSLFAATLILIVLAIGLERIRTRLAGDAEGRLVTALDEIPPNALIVLLGCPTQNRDGGPNRYFTARVAAAAAAYHAIKARVPTANPLLLCSGLDAHGEVRAFQDALMLANVPEGAIQLDGEAARTLESVDYVAELSTPRPIYFVSQHFHLPRVLFLCRARRLAAWGVIAEGELSRRQAKLREFLAFGRAIFDVVFTRKRRA